MALSFATGDLVGKYRLYRDPSESEAKVRSFVDANIVGLSPVSQP